MVSLALVIVKLPYLKNKRLPRIATEPLTEKLVSGHPKDLMEDAMVDELIEAVQGKDVRLFRMALEALLLNSLEWESHED